MYQPWQAASLLVLSSVLLGCGAEANEGAEAAVVEEAPATDSVAYEPEEPVGPATDLPPNELGEIMVLEYHRIGEPEGEFYRTLDNFRSDLQRLYEAGYRPVTMKQVTEGNLDVPRGTTPVVFTIDDSSTGQFYFLEDGTVDPNTMVGVWEEFSRQNPGWDGGATWCVLPAADHPSNFFGEKPSREVPREEREQTIQRKIDFLIERDHEICNHTLYHARLDRARDDAQVQEWIGRGEDSIRAYLPDDYRISTLALPLGQWPNNRALASAGTHDGRPYRYDAVLEVSGGPNESPFDRAYDPMSVDRLIVAPGSLERQLEAYEQNPARRFISDGDSRIISVPASEVDRVDRDRWPDRQVVPVEPSSAPVAESAAS